MRAKSTRAQKCVRTNFFAERQGELQKMLT